MFFHFIRFRTLLSLLAALVLTACTAIENKPSNVDFARLSRIQEGMSKQEVINVLGPPDPSLTVLFQRRNELVLGWTFQEIGEPFNFHVLLDADKETVRSTMITPFRVIVDFH